MHPLERYHPLIDDIDAFTSALARPLPLCIWANPLRTDRPTVATILEADGYPFQALPWCGFALQSSVNPALGRHWAFFAGLFHIQEAVSLLPALALAPEPGEQVLDLCAAPGNKTALLATMMQNRGLLLANDLKQNRLRAIRQNVERLGLQNVAICHGNGTNIPNHAGGFDRVLVDVPCSCEGTSRKHPEVLQQVGAAFSVKQSSVQKALLKKAVQLCRPGGRVVYATCTYAPEENEAVVDAVLQESKDPLTVRPFQLPGLVSCPGLTEWDGQLFDERVSACCRIWPHLNDSGGFFIAVLEKAEDGQGTNSENNRQEQPGDFDSGWQSEIAARFGLPDDIWRSYRFHTVGDDVFVTLDSPHPPPSFSTESRGLLFLRTHVAVPKLTASGAMAIGAQATRNVVSVPTCQLEAYQQRQVIPVTPEQLRCCDPGYVIVRHGEHILGMGHLTDDNGWQMRSLFPKRWRKSRRRA